MGALFTPAERDFVDLFLILGSITILMFAPVRITKIMSRHIAKCVVFEEHCLLDRMDLIQEKTDSVGRYPFQVGIFMEGQQILRDLYRGIQGQRVIII